MTTNPGRRGRRRWLLLSSAFVVLAALAAWLSGGPLAAFVLERQLRNAGWLEAHVAGGSLVFQDAAGNRRMLPSVLFDRVTLTSEDTLVAENVRARVGRKVEHLAVGRLRVAATLTPDGALRLPGAPASRGGDPPLDLVPPDGITLNRAELGVQMPGFGVRVELSRVTIERTVDGVRVAGDYATSDAGVGTIDYSSAGRIAVEIDGGGNWSTLLQIDDGRFASGDAHASGIEGVLTAVGSAGGDVPSFELESDASNVRWGAADLGALAVTAAFSGGSGEVRVVSRDSSVADIAIDARIAPTDDARTAEVTGRVRLESPAVQGLVAFDAALAMPMDARSPPAMLDAARGRVTLRAADASAAGAFSQGSIDASADIAVEAGELLVSFHEASAEIVPDARVVPEAAAAYAGTALAVLLGRDGDAPASIRIALAERSAQFAGRIDMRSGDIRLGAALRAAISPGMRSGGLAGADVAAELSSLAVENLPWNGVTLAIDDFAGTVEHAADQWRVDGAGRITAQGERASTRFTGLLVEWAGTVTGTNEQLQIHARDCIAWNVGELEIADVRIAGLAPPCMTGDDGGLLLSRDRSSGRSALAFALEAQPLAARVTHGGETWTVEGAWPELEVEGVIDADGIERLSARFANGALTSASHGLAAERVSGMLEMSNGALAPSTLRVGKLESLESPPWLVPVELRVDAVAEAGGIAFDASASDPLGTFVLDVAGTHDSTRTSAAMRLYPVRFVPGATEIEDLSPRLGELVRDVTGLAELAGRVEWAGDALLGDATLQLENLSATVSGVPIEGLGAEIELTRLAPPATALDQLVTIERVDFGMPLEDGVAVVTLREDGQIAFSRLDFAFAGGRLFAEPFTIDSVDADDIGFVLRAEEVQMAEFLASSRIEGLAGTGTLSGRVPVRLSERGIRLDAGVLAAETDGVLRYTPNDLPDFLRGDDVRSRMLREVLTNFHYEELSLAVSGDSAEGGEQRLALNARGSNPDFLEGHPIELAFNFTGPLLGAVRSAVDLSGAAELEERFERRNTDNEENSR